MSTRNTKRLVEAVNFLIQSDKYSMLIREITEIVERWDTHPMAYEGHLEVLNELIEIGLQSRVAFENVVKLIETKRKAIPAIKRVDYQRTLMQERRARMAKALDLHERTIKPIKTTTERTMLTAQYQKRWAKAKKEFLHAKGKISWKARNIAMAEFWAGIDAKLDEALRGGSNNGAKKKEPA